MSAQPQPPQQPIFPNELNTALERFGARLITIFDARIDGLTIQMRSDKQDSMQRDQDLANVVLNFREETRSRISALEADIANTKRYLVAITKALNIQDLRPQFGRSI